MYVKTALLLLLLFSGIWLLKATWAGSPQDSLPSRKVLRQQLRQLPPWLIIYDLQDDSLQQQLMQWFATLPKQESRSLPPTLLAASEVTDSLLRQQPVLLICDKLPTNVVQTLERIPAVGLDHGQLTFDTTQLNPTTDAIRLHIIPGFWDLVTPVSLLYAPDARVLADALRNIAKRGTRDLLRPLWGYEIMRHGQTWQCGHFNDTTWQVLPPSHYTFDPQPQAIASSKYLDIWAYDQAKPDFTTLEQVAYQAAKGIADFSGSTALPRLQLYTYPDPSHKALRTHIMRQAHADEANQCVHAIWNERCHGLEMVELARLWVHYSLPSAAIPWLEYGLAMQWVDTLADQPWRGWSRALAKADALLTPEELRQEPTLQTAPLIGLLSAAAWVDFRLAQMDKGAFWEEYENGLPASDALKKEWLDWIEAHYPTKAPRAEAKLPWMKGMTLAHEGYQVYNGYGGHVTAHSIAALQMLHANAVAIVPYSFMPDPRQPSDIPVSQFAGGENDEAILNPHFLAQQSGMQTLLKPQIWVGGGHWPGDIRFDTPADWEAFFGHYKRWICHYALLAEMHGFDALCVGTELRHTTLEQPQAWRQLVADIQELYSGPLTYAANWGEECEQLSFWDAFDYIGINAYYPLHKGDTASDADLATGVQKMMDKIENIHQQQNLPVWLTEIGYRSATAPWVNPHAEADNRAIDEAAQARCYQALLQEAVERPWLRGLFWWKWPSDLSYYEDEGRGYMPWGKPAAIVLEQYYGRGWE
ncbi:MAG: hypothetical protein R2795_27135 [Saprospiraceae bacterium]